MIKTALLSGTCIALMASSAVAEIKVGFIGSLSSDTGLSTLRGAEVAIEELNANGGVLGQQITLVSADTGQDPTEGVRAYEYLAETEEVDFIISGSIDDVSLGWLPRMQEYRIPTAGHLDILYRHHRHGGRRPRGYGSLFHEHRLGRGAGNAVH